MASTIALQIGATSLFLWVIVVILESKKESSFFVFISLEKSLSKVKVRFQNQLLNVYSFCYINAISSTEIIIFGDKLSLI